MAYERTSGGGYISNPLSTVNNTQKKKEQNNQSGGAASTTNTYIKSSAQQEAEWAAKKEEERRQERVAEQAHNNAAAQKAEQLAARKATNNPVNTTSTTTYDKGGTVTSVVNNPVNTSTTTTATTPTTNNSVNAGTSAITTAQQAAKKPVTSSVANNSYNDANAQKQEQLAEQRRAAEQAAAQKRAAEEAAQRKAQEEAEAAALAARQAEMRRKAEEDAAIKAAQERARQEAIRRAAERERDERLTTTAQAADEAKETGGNLVVPQSYKPTDSNSGTSAQQYNNPVNTGAQTGMSPEQLAWLESQEGQTALANQQAQAANDQALREAALRNDPFANFRVGTPGEQRYDARYPRTTVNTPQVTTTTNPLQEWVDREYPEYTGDQSPAFMERNFYRGRELMQPQATVAEQTSNARGLGNILARTPQAEETEFYLPEDYEFATAGVGDLSPFTEEYTPSYRYDPYSATRRLRDMNGEVPPEVAEQYETFSDAWNDVIQLQDRMRPDVDLPDVVPLGSSSKRGTYPYARYGEGNTVANIGVLYDTLASIINGAGKYLDPNQTNRGMVEDLLGALPAIDYSQPDAEQKAIDRYNRMADLARQIEADDNVEPTPKVTSQQVKNAVEKIAGGVADVGKGLVKYGIEASPLVVGGNAIAPFISELGNLDSVQMDAVNLGYEPGTKEFIDYVNTHKKTGDRTPITTSQPNIDSSAYYNRLYDDAYNDLRSKGYNDERARYYAQHPDKIVNNTGNPINQNTGNLALEASIRRGDTTYQQVYDDYVANHKDAIGEDDARRLAYQRIYDLGYRPDINDPKSYEHYTTGMSEDFIDALEKAGPNGGNNYYTNAGSYNDRYINMLAGGFDRSYDQERLFDDLTSELAGNAFANQYEWTGKDANDKKGKWVERANPLAEPYATTPGYSGDDKYPQNGALQAALNGGLTTDQILHFYDANYSDLVIPPEAQRWMADDSTRALLQDVINNRQNLDRLQKEHGTKEELFEALRALMDANPGLKLLYDSGRLNMGDIANQFAKAPVDDTGAVDNPFAGNGGTSNSPYPGYYEWNGQLYPIDQEKAKYYLRYGTYDGWDEGMRDYYNTFGTFYGYRPDWRTAGRKNTWKNNTGGRSYNYSGRNYSGGNYSSGGNSYSRGGWSYGGNGRNTYVNNYNGNGSGYSYSNGGRTEQAAVNPSARNQKQNRVYNIMKNWSF